MKIMPRHRPTSALDQLRRSTSGATHLSEIHLRLHSLYIQQAHMAKIAGTMENGLRATNVQAAEVSKTIKQLSELLPAKHVYGQATPLSPRARGGKSHA